MNRRPSWRVSEAFGTVEHLSNRRRVSVGREVGASFYLTGREKCALSWRLPGPEVSMREPGGPGRRS